MNNKPLKLTTLLLVSALAAGCASTASEDKGANQGIKTGAISGALVGLTMGALTGDASLAMKGAVMGGVTGGAAGAVADYENSREDHRTETLAAAIAQPKATQTTSADTTKHTQHLDKLVGQWRVDIWTLDKQGNKLYADGKALGSLNSTSEAKISLNDIKVKGSQAVLTGETLIGYSHNTGHTLKASTSVSEGEVSFSGEYQPNHNRYNFYPVSQVNRTDIHPSQLRVEMRFACSQVWLVETYLEKDGKEQQIQSYRFTKTG